MDTVELLRIQANTWDATSIPPQSELLRTAADELAAAQARLANSEEESRAQTKLLQQMTDDRVELQCKVTELMDRVVELEGERDGLLQLSTERYSEVIELQAKVAGPEGARETQVAAVQKSLASEREISGERWGQLCDARSKVAELEGELSDEKFLHQRAYAALLRLNMQLGADALGEEVGESIIDDCNADREKWARMSTARFGPSGHPSKDRATKPRPMSEAPDVWLIQHLGGKVDAWWCANASGYTTEIVAAGVYTEAEAIESASNRPQMDKAVRLSDALMGLRTDKTVAGLLGWLPASSGGEGEI